MTLDMEKLTAYVLGELDDAERQAVEEFIMGDEAAQEAVAELRATAAFAREALHVAQPAELAPEQRADIEARLKVAVPRPSRFSLPGILTAVAVLSILSVLVVPYMSGSGDTPFKMASEDSGMSPAAREAKGKAKSVPEEGSLSSPSQGQKADEDRLLNRSRVEKLNELQKSTVLSAIPEYIADAPADAPAKAEEAKPTSERLHFPVARDFGSQGQEVDGDVVMYQAYKAAEDMWEKPLAKKESESKTLETVESATENARSENWNMDYEGEAAYQFRARNGLVAPQNDPALNDPNKVYWPGHNTEAYDKITDNPFKDVTQEPLSTFSIDVDTASYSNVRRFLTQGSMPPPDSVRIEELLNYFDYDYAPPADKSIPFASHIEVAACPWAPEHRLARVALKGWEMAANERPASNLVFLIDVSGSMQPENKLPLLKEALRMLVRQLDERDRIAMVVYAGSSGLVLPSTPGNEQAKILGAIDRLESGGSTHGSAGIQLAYETAVQNFLPGATNRVLLCTDGDFNVGVTDEGQLVRIIEEKAKSGVFLTVLGFGMGNLKDANLEQLADKGNGNYAYIDTLNEARKVLVQGLSGTLVTIAKDVKIQIEFNPAKVQAYRLIGYENRIMAKEDFNDDTKDAGEIGAGHSVTALYELVPPGASTPGAPSVDPLKYQQPVQPKPEATSDELFTLKLRYKAPDGDTSKLLEYPARDTGSHLPQATPDFRFASAVAEFGMLLRNSPYKGASTYDAVLNLAEGGIGKDSYGYRTEFMQLVQKAKAMMPQTVE